eukprot:4302167-Pyramimonas_sp.AAC.1
MAHPLNSMLYKVPWILEAACSPGAHRLATRLSSFGANAGGDSPLELFCTLEASDVDRLFHADTTLADSDAWNADSLACFRCDAPYPREFCRAIAQCALIAKFLSDRS